MTPRLHPAFCTTPLAHRAYHDRSQGRPENSRAAIRSAIAQGYGIEIDLQLSADGAAMVFHDYDLARLTGQPGPLRRRSAAELQAIALAGGDGETIPTLAEILELVVGAVPLLIELKDQDGAMGPDIGPLEAAAAGALAGYDGPVAVMSFNPHSVAEMARLAPGVPRGLTTCAFDPEDWPLDPETCARLREIPDIDRVRASFISHQASDLGSARVRELRKGGLAVLCWTIRSPEEEAEARKVAHNITFEGYKAVLPA